MAAVEIKRYRGVLIAGGAVAVAALAINFTLLLSLGPAPKGIVPHQLAIGWNLINSVDQTVAGISKLQRDGKISDKDFYGAFIGVSSAGAGIDCGVLSEQVVPGGKFTSFGISGLSFNNLLSSSMSFFYSDISPDVIILCLHPWMFVGDPANPKTDMNPFPHMMQGKWLDADRATRPWMWVSANRRYINNSIRMTLHEMRMKMFNHLKLNYDAFAAPREHPWGVKDTPGHDQAFNINGEHDRRMMDAYQKRGWFDPAQYERLYESSGRDLVQLIDGCRSRGSKVVIVIMPDGNGPDGKGLLASLPPIAKQNLYKIVTDTYGKNAPPIFDYEDMMASDMFTDFVHLKFVGRMALSERLAADIRNYLASQDQPK